LLPGVYTLNVLRNSLYLTAFGWRDEVSGQRIGSGAVWLGVACLLAGAIAMVASRRRYGLRISPQRFAPGHRNTTVFALVAAYSVGALAVIEFANATRLTSAPFERHSLFVGFAVVLWMLRQLRRDAAGLRWRRRVFGILVAGNLVAAAIGVTLLVSGYDYSPWRYWNVLVATPPPTLRDVSALGATSVVCSRKDMSVCRIYVPYLRRRGVRVTSTPWTTDRHRCVTGRVPPFALHGVVVWRGKQELGLLCEK
jgi:hypothetical protein